jgi:hypothetical protein
MADRAPTPSERERIDKTAKAKEQEDDDDDEFIPPGAKHLKGKEQEEQSVLP